MLRMAWRRINEFPVQMTPTIEKALRKGAVCFVYLFVCMCSQQRLNLARIFKISSSSSLLPNMLIIIIINFSELLLYVMLSRMRSQRRGLAPGWQFPLSASVGRKAAIRFNQGSSGGSVTCSVCPELLFENFPGSLFQMFPI